jgi:hypothetical protein
MGFAAEGAKSGGEAPSGGFGFVFLVVFVFVVGCRVVVERKTGGLLVS